MNNNNIDESLYSRQLYTIGMDSMCSISKSRIIIDGSDGLAVEIAKNCILTGFMEVLMYDSKSHVIKYDICTNYYLREDDIGKDKISVLLPRLAELNPNVTVSKYTDINSIIGDKEKNNMNIVVIHVNKSIDYAINFAQENGNIKYIYANTYGLVGQIFCDFGEYNVTDMDGDQPKKGIIKSINGKIINTVDIHKLQTGDTIRFIGDTYIYKIKYINNDVFELNILPQKNTYTDYVQIKNTCKISHVKLGESVNNPKFVTTDYFDFDKPNKLHNLCLGRSIDDKELYKKFHYCKDYELTPINSIIGGIVSQEVIKAITCKYMPIDQWLYYDALNCLADNYNNINNINKYESVCIDRYYNQRKIFGEKFQEKMLKQTFFVVGAGAIGCELLKNFAMMGLGNIIITDMDIIEKSNLNRQFLFRQGDIGEFKSIVAKKAICEVNNDINIIAMKEKVCTDTENVFNKEFYENLDGIVNALDNIQARMYIDSRVITFHKPLLESGTLGTKCNVQVVIPNATESYGIGSDSGDDIPVCTLKFFPNLIEHCIQWAKDDFFGLFVNGPCMFMNNDTETDPDMYYFILDNIPSSYNDCIDTANKYWYMRYCEDINKLLEKYPKDKIEDGKLFWSEGKRCPKPLIYPDDDYKEIFSKLWWNIYKDVDNIKPELFEKDDDSNGHIKFITIASNQRALNYGIEPVDFNETKRIAGNIIPALATTTSVVAGLVAIELYKLINNKDVSSHRNTFANLAINFYGNTEPVKNENIWKRDIIETSMTINDLVSMYDKKGIELDYISYGTFMLYSPLMDSFECDDDNKNDNRYIGDILRDNIDNVTYPIILNIGICDDNDDNISNIHYYGN